jgi:hypothetical protein
MGPLGNDLGSIAAIVAVLRQSLEAGGGVKTERTNPSRSRRDALARGYLLLQIDSVACLSHFSDGHVILFRGRHGLQVDAGRSQRRRLVAPAGARYLTRSPALPGRGNGDCHRASRRSLAHPGYVRDPYAGSELILDKLAYR